MGFEIIKEYKLFEGLYPAGMRIFGDSGLARSSFDAGIVTCKDEYTALLKAITGGKAR
jgi:hypothetical protein